MPQVSDRPVSQTANSSIDFLNDVIEGLLAPTRSLPSKYFYDEIGSALFDEICELDEYYPTRLETEIMVDGGEEIADRLGSNVRLVEFGSGSSRKTRVLLDHLVDPSLYVPIDISAEHLMRTADSLASEYPLLNVSPVVADFTMPVEIPACDHGECKTCVYFPGSTIGNFVPSEAMQLLADVADSSEVGDGLLIGFDLQKEVAVIEAAYNDRAGVTAAFNKNVLYRINAELGADFDVEQFAHLAFYNELAGRIEMHLVSQCEQNVTIGDRTFHFGWGEAIRTEYSHKYTVDGFANLAAQVGWRRTDFWTDAQDYFAVMYLER